MGGSKPCIMPIGPSVTGLLMNSESAFSLFRVKLMEEVILLFSGEISPSVCPHLAEARFVQLSQAQGVQDQDFLRDGKTI